MTLSEKVEIATHAWARKGDKRQRASQRKLMKEFASHAELTGARDAGQVGNSTVIKFWKKQRSDNKSFEEQMIYWSAIRELWIIWGRAGEPPLPNEPIQPACDFEWELYWLALTNF